MEPSLITPESKPTGVEDVDVSHQAEASMQLERHSDLWFDDGSVICQAENTLFKVHMSQLARHSVCFRDMFSLPQPVSMCCSSNDLASTCTTGNSQQSQRIPVIQLHDTAEDVGNLLTALYDGPNFGDNGHEDFRSVSGILRLSTKYIIDSLRWKALAHLSIVWPSDLKTWDTREDLSRAYETDSTSHGGHLYPHPIAVINLAREVNAPSLLPAAFYDLSRYSYTQIFEPTEEDPSYRPSCPAFSLSAIDLQRLCLGKEAAHQTITSLITAMGSSQHIRPQQNSTHAHIRRTSFGGVCISAAACRKDFSELVDLATQHYLFDRERGYCDPLYVAEELGQLKSAEFSECKACAKSLEAWAAREREKIWKSIPMWFRLDTPISSPTESDLN
ncbi:hypothetical protein L208DRAFT_1305889 [Tricholoma matsutake]|nr:hypothetical protein L208DRAFT_1305889 [Tricholoma matsutake 945]